MATLSDIMDLIDGIDEAKADLKTSIAGKGVAVPSSAKLAELPALVDDIEQGITPTGTLNISANGTYDVTEKASAEVNVPGIVPTGTKQITLTANGTTTEDVSAYANAEITVNVSGGGGDSVITGSFTPATDVATYDVTVGADSIRYFCYYVSPTSADSPLGHSKRVQYGKLTDVVNSSRIIGVASNSSGSQWSSASTYGSETSTTYINGVMHCTAYSYFIAGVTYDWFAVI